ncbi:MAG: cytochrome c [Leptospiraceae bacterium]|nr:cytochrome c [Leptospiraceae bacterium]
MKRNLKYILLTFAIVGLSACGVPRGFPAFQFFPDMYDSLAVESQEADKTNPTGGPRTPPPGTISVDQEIYDYEGEASYGSLPGGGLSFPANIKKTMANYKRGEERYHINCYPCHGARGKGDGPVVGPAPRMAYSPAMDLIDGPLAPGMTDGQIYHVIKKGNGQMPAYGAQITQEDRWKIILYVRKLQEAGKKAASNN